MIKFKVAARTDVGLVRTNNEDNFQISRDLSIEPMRWVNNEMCALGAYGCLLVVADGMGGANVGEVASQIAMDTIKSEFIPSKLKDIRINNPESVNQYISNVIVDADKNIKNYADTHPETKGMGTTIVVAWLINDKLFIGWCGDSRAYLFNPSYGLVRLTKDHSYVQQLVDSKKLTEEEAFDFPDSNIITNCLSASTQKAKPETLPTPITVSNNDILLLCTDGLCGMLKDTGISSVIKLSQDNLTDLANDLVSSALKASGADNVTVALCKICSGARTAPQFFSQVSSKRKVTKNVYLYIASVVIIFGVILSFCIRNNKSDNQGQVGNQAPIGTVPNLRTTEQTTEETQANEAPQIEDIVDAPIIDDAKKEKSVILDKLKNELSKPSDSEAKSENELIEGEIDDNVEADDEPEIIVVTIPNGLSIGNFMQRHNMNMSDFKKLNPDLNPEDLKPGMKIKIYKK